MKPKEIDFVEALTDYAHVKPAKSRVFEFVVQYLPEEEIDKLYARICKLQPENEVSIPAAQVALLEYRVGAKDPNVIFSNEDLNIITSTYLALTKSVKKVKAIDLAKLLEGSFDMEDLITDGNEQ